ncbi:hypothetical protein QBC47DRAFT_2641 [Echria macrotheca]|uniref:Heterokaryon incompatibility domain-containing protein n=1 Tax=Echria macrotheca TaxID=438768 RepID=A0AAJ0BL76_9PEZI|nr:hypothetical protein QBC47DRAFT_2641 [Echria macrotheca]
MRLLDARSLGFVDVHDGNAPRYAILSHTWGNEEVTLQEMRRVQGKGFGKLPHTALGDNEHSGTQNQQITTKKGFDKIRKAAETAVQRGLDFIWVDTCCIDKTSSSELSEAINSMYQWYHQAAECYAILSDVDPANEDSWLCQKSQLRCSRWFTRGWTLQELIAPANVLFFASNWSLLGRKNEPKAFSEVICEITGIDVAVLDGRLDPAQLSVATRMKWASARQTTRLEDSAYCLMGLFQVHMPLLYGEGNRAFARLQEEIIRRSDDQSLFAWNASCLSIRDQDVQTDPDQLCGLLAKYPAQFGDPGELQLLPSLRINNSVPSAMTNLGLQVQLYLRPVHEHEVMPMEEDYYAVLNCVVPVGDQYLCPAIPLRRLSEVQYARLQAKPPKLLVPPHSDQEHLLEGYRTIYVRQDPFYYHIPPIRVAPIHWMLPGGEAISLNSHPSSSLAGPSREFASTDTPAPTSYLQHYILVDAHPPSGWNPHLRTMALQYSRELKAMAIFRFRAMPSRNGGDDSVVDVAVGLHRQHGTQWEGWCLQLSGHGTSSLSSVMNTINMEIKQLVGSNRLWFQSPTALRDALGDDRGLVSSASVARLQLHGHWYISLSVTNKHELPTQQVALGGKSDVEARPMATVPRALVQSPYGNARIGGSDSLPPQRILGVTLSRLTVTHPGPSGNSESLPHQAAFCGDTEAVRILSRQLLGSVNQTDKFGRSPLWWAAAGGRAENVKTLVSMGALINLSDDLGLTPLHEASRCGHLETVTALLGLRASQGLRTHYLDLSPLDLASMFGHHKVVTELLDNLEGVEGAQLLLDRALHIAASCGRLSCVQLLLAAAANPLNSYDYYFKMRNERETDATIVELHGNARLAAIKEGFHDIVQQLRLLEAQQTERPLPGHRFVPRLRRGPDSAAEITSPQQLATDTRDDSPASTNPFWPNGMPAHVLDRFCTNGTFCSIYVRGLPTEEVMMSTNPFRRKTQEWWSDSSEGGNHDNQTHEAARMDDDCWPPRMLLDGSAGPFTEPPYELEAEIPPDRRRRHELDAPTYQPRDPISLGLPPPNQVVSPPLRYVPSSGQHGPFAPPWDHQHEFMYIESDESASDEE